MRIDLHTHSAVSDGTDTPSELVTKARSARLDVVALADHDTFDGIAAAQLAAQQCGVEVICGIEISAEFNGTSVHLLGYGCDPENEALAVELATIRAGRDGRIPAILAKLVVLGLPVTADEVAAQVGNSPSVGRPHIADALVAKGYIASRDEAFATLLYDGGPAFVPRYGVPLTRGIDLIHGAGGVAVIAHPWGRVSRSVLTPEVLRELVDDHGLDALEVEHGDHDQSTRAELSDLAASLGLLVTGGSDYHGAGKVGHDLGSELTAPSMWAELLASIRSQ